MKKLSIILILATFISIDNKASAHMAFAVGRGLDNFLIGLDFSPDEKIIADLNIQLLYGFYSLVSMQVRGGFGYRTGSKTPYARIGGGFGFGELVATLEFTQSFEKKTATGIFPGLTLIAKNIEFFTGIHIYLYQRENNSDFFVLGLRFFL